MKTYQERFRNECSQEIEKQSSEKSLVKATKFWMDNAHRLKYSYHFSWLGRPIIQYPQDMVAMQEIIWEVRPDLIIETGIAHGGSLIFSASMLALLEMSAKIKRSKVLGVDIDIREHNRIEIEKHPLADRIQMLQGSSINEDIIEQVHEFAKGYNNVMIFLDSNHTHVHVLEELKAYAPLVTKGSYCVVFDTIIEDMPEDMFPDRPWGKGDNPKTAIWEYLKMLDAEEHRAADGDVLKFETDKVIDKKLIISVSPEGYLKRA